MTADDGRASGADWNEKVSDDDRKIELIDELWELLDGLEPGQSTGTLMRAWAERTLAAERAAELDERAAILAFLEVAKAPRCMIDLIARGTHRMRSSTGMQALRDSQCGSKDKP